MTTPNFETTILSQTIYNDRFLRKAFAHIKEEYFQSKPHQIVFGLLEDFIKKYNERPSKEALYLSLGAKTGITEQDYSDCQELLKSLENNLGTGDEDWLFDTAEKFCQERALHNAIRSGIQILDGKGKTNLQPGILPQMFSDALGITFDTKVGHDYVDDSDQRYDFYSHKEDKIPLDLDILNEILAGGVSRKTLNVFMAGVGIGKTLVKCHLAASHLTMGYNVLYITMEMAEERIAERVDANLLDCTIDELHSLPKSVYEKKISRLKEKSLGKLIIKEYPTGSAGAANFRYLINELKQKKNFKPDIIYIDYINICASNKLKLGSNVNTYSYVKSVAEELRALAMELGVAIITSTQVNRSGYSDSDFDMDSTAESWGLPQTVDVLLGVIRTEELDNQNQMMVKQLKNRYYDLTKKRKFVIGVDRSKMRLFSVDNHDIQSRINTTSVPVMDNTDFGQREAVQTVTKPKFNFTEFK